MTLPKVRYTNFMSPVKTLSVFFPAYNEEENIANTVSQAIKVLESLKLDNYEIIVVDDGSTDRTAAVVQNLAARNSKIRLIRHGRNRGYGAALKTGFSSAKFDWIAFTDSDGQFDFREINKFLDHVPSYQVVAGYRKQRSDSKFRRMMAFLLRVWDTILFGLHLQDVDCGFKLIKKSVIDKIFPLVTESAITETEMMTKIHRAGFPIKQIGVAHHSRTQGIQTGGNFTVIFRAVLESVKLFLHFNPSFPLFTSILLTATLLRLYRIRDYLSFLGDEGRDALVWLHMTQGHFTFLGPTASVGGFYLGPIYYYLALPFYWIWRDPVGPAIFVALVGVATVGLVYTVGKRWFGEVAGIVGAWLYAIAALVVRYSRASWNPNPLPFFSLLGAYWMTEGMRRRSWWRVFGAGLCLGIAWQLHYLAVILAPVYVTIGIVEFLRTRQKFRSSHSFLLSFLFPLFLLLLGWMISFFPFLAFEVYHHFPNTRTVIEFVTRPGGGVLNFELLGLSRSFLRHTNELFFHVFSWPDGRFSILTSALAVVVGSGIAIKMKQWGFLLWFFLGLAIFSLYQGSISDYYFGFLFPAPFLFLGAVAGKLWSKARFGPPLVLLFLSLITLDQSTRWPTSQAPNMMLSQTQRIALRVIELSGGNDFNFALITGGNSDHAYRYFLERQGRTPRTLEQQITDQLIVVCEKPVAECQPLGNPVWEVAGFGRAEIDKQTTVPPGITIYRLVHYQEL